MAKQIITLGIGAMDNLTPFILTGLDIIPSPMLLARGGAAYIPYREKRAMIPFRDKRAVNVNN